MTRDRAKALLPIIAAYANGETIQEWIKRWPDCENPKWIDIDFPPFGNASKVFRIKPKPREWWIVGDYAFLTQNEALDYADRRFPPTTPPLPIHVTETP